MVRTLLALFMAACAAVTAAHSQEYERIGAFLTQKGQEDLVFLAGDITSQTPLDFKAVLNRFPKAKTLVLSSAGGSVTGGLLLADDVFVRGLNTYIPANLGCYSACSFVFFAGKARQATGELGVHQFHGGEDTAERAQVVVSDILDMLTKFGTPQPVVSRMLRTSSENMYVFSQAEIADLEINRGAKALRSVETAMAEMKEPLRVALAASIAEAAVASTAPTPQQPPASSSLRFAVYEGVDFYGQDVDKIRVPDLGQCLAACFENKQCRAVTLNINPAFKTGPNCFLKSGTGRGEFYELAISGQLLLPDEEEYFSVSGQRIHPVEIFTGD